MKLHIVIYPLLWILLWVHKKKNKFQQRCFSLQYEFSDGGGGGHNGTCRNMDCVRILELLSA